MPGFAIGGRGGINSPANTTETRRRHRWVFETLGTLAAGRQVLILLKSAGRPHSTIEEVEMHHDQEKVWFAGKHSWEPITLTWYDAEQAPDVSSAIWDWLNTVIDIPGATTATPSSYKGGNATLSMLSANGAVNESWTMFGVWPQDVNWQDLDYTNTEIQEIEVTIRYDRAERQ